MTSGKQTQALFGNPTPWSSEDVLKWPLGAHTEIPKENKPQREALSDKALKAAGDQEGCRERRMRGRESTALDG